MPSAVIYPNAKATLPIRDVPTSRSIKAIRSLLLFFDDFIILTEALPEATIQIGSPHRRLTIGPELDFLSKQELVFESLAPPDRALWEATKFAQESFAEGIIFKDEFMRETDPASHSRDVFVSMEASQHFEETSATLTIEFLDGLTIAPKDVSFEDILYFKQKRSYEYQAFWEGVFSLARNVDWTEGSEPERKLRHAVLDNLEAYERVAQETWSRRVVDNLKLSLTLDKPALATVAGAVAGTALGQLPVSGSLILGALGMVRFSIDLLPSRPSMPQGAHAMAYLSRIKDLNPG